MNKEEVLRRAQDKKPNKMDEMELDIMNKGGKVGVLVGLQWDFLLDIWLRYSDESGDMSSQK